METEQTKRENPEPSEMHYPLPWPVKLLMVSLMIWGAYYILTTAHRPSDAGDHILIDASLNPKNAVAGVEGLASVSGAQVYNANCASCHQATGNGLAGVFPPLAGSRWVTGSDQRLIQILLAGLSGPIEVLGVEYNGVMPAFGGILSDAQIAAVASYIRQSWANDASPIDASLVKEMRKDTQEPPWTVKQLNERFGD